MDSLNIKLQKMFSQFGRTFDGVRHAMQPLSGTAHSMSGATADGPGSGQDAAMQAGSDAAPARVSEYDSDSIGVWNLLGPSGRNDLLTDAFAWVIAARCNPFSRPFIPALGMSQAAFAALLEEWFPQFLPPQRWLDVQNAPVGIDGVKSDFRDLLQLLLDHRAERDLLHLRVAHLVASACMGEGALWRNVGLPDRAALGDLLYRYFPALAESNHELLPWKKFFYLQISEYSGYPGSLPSSSKDRLYYPKSFSIWK